MAIQNLAHRVGTAAACEALGVPRSSYYRSQARAHHPSPPLERPHPPLALSERERQQVLAVLHAERFVDQAPPSVYATLLDEGQYLCSVRTMYRILADADEVRERRNQLHRPAYAKPELLATGPNQVWSWDITKLKGPAKWSYFYLYVILDIFSRYVVGWMLAQREAADLAKRLIADSGEKQAVDPDRLTLHADRGPSMPGHKFCTKFKATIMAGNCAFSVRGGRACEDANRVGFRWPLTINRSWNSWPAAEPYRGFKSNAPGRCWRWPAVSACRRWPGRCSAPRPPSGACVGATNRSVWPVSWPKRPAQVIPLRFPPLQRAQIVQLACLEPIAKGLHLTHWSSRDLARQAVMDGIVPSISARTIRRILQEVDLQPHRTRYWKTACLDGQFKQRTEQILWCYANARRLVQEGLWIVCVDEMPNLQAIERTPIRRAIPGEIEHQEFEYTRHGTVNVLVFLIVHSGRMEATCPARKDAAHYLEALQQFRYRHRHLRGVFLIQDGDPSHTATATQEYFHGQPWWRPRFTPAHASWLNQAELLNDAFSFRYLKHGSWQSRQALLDHIAMAWPEYNQLYAHPFEWTWTNRKMRQWFAEHASDSS